MTNKLPVVGKRYRATDSNKFIHNKNFVLTCDEVSDYMIILNKKEDASYIGWPAKDFFDDYEELPEDKAETKLDATSESVDVKKEEVKEKFILDSIYYDKQGLPVSIYKKEEEIDRIKMEKLREYFKEKYKSYETQPDENGSFKHIDGIEEETQDLMKESMKPNKETLKSFSDYEKGIGLTKHDSVKELFEDLEEESIWKPVSELPKFEKERGQPDLLIRFDDENVRFGTFNGFFSDVKGSAFKQKYVKQYCLLKSFISDYENLKERVKKLEGK